MASNFFAKLQQGLSKTRDNIAKGIDNVFSGFSTIDDDFYEDEEIGDKKSICFNKFAFSSFCSFIFDFK